MGKALVLSGVDFSSVAVTQVTLQEEVPCTAVTLNKQTITFETVGETSQLTATLTPSNTTDTVIWASSNTNVATVDNTGLVTIHGIGTATITATCGSASASATINQTSIKPQYAMKTLAGYTAINSNTNGCMIIESNSGQNAIGQSNHNTTDLAVIFGSDRDFELIRVPYGATKAKVATSDGNQVQISYAYIADTTSLVTVSGKQYPAYVSRSTFVKSDVGLDVAYGQAFAFRATDAQMPTLSYIYFT